MLGGGDAGAGAGAVYPVRLPTKLPPSMLTLPEVVLPLFPLLTGASLLVLLLRSSGSGTA